jgi:hypothetical protein
VDWSRELAPNEKNRHLRVFPITRSPDHPVSSHPVSISAIANLKSAKVLKKKALAKLAFAVCMPVYTYL